LRNALANTNSYSHSYGYGYGHSYCDSNSYCNSDSYRYANGYGDSNCYGHSDGHCYSHGNCHSHADTQADTYTQASADTKTSSDACAETVATLAGAEISRSAKGDERSVLTDFAPLRLHAGESRWAVLSRRPILLGMDGPRKWVKILLTHFARFR
jgi:hypothetical protein